MLIEPFFGTLAVMHRVVVQNQEYYALGIFGQLRRELDKCSEVMAPWFLGSA
jgi:hypothetical protein